MLVLSRKKQQSILIGDDIEVTVLEVNGSRVQLGISAPREVIVRRSELLESKPQAVTFRCSKPQRRLQTGCVA